MIKLQLTYHGSFCIVSYQNSKFFSIFFPLQPNISVQKFSLCCHLATLSIQSGISTDAEWANGWQWTDVSVGWHLPWHAKNSTFSLKSQPFLRRENLVYLFISAYSALVNGKAAWGKPLTGPMFLCIYFHSINIIWVLGHIWGSEVQHKVNF